MEKKFTIIICTYNSENRISNVLDNVINQCNIEFLVDKVLIVDNNSIDNTKNIVDTYRRKYKYIQYVFEEKQGLSNARLAGVNNTNSEWIIFIDDDNILHKKWLVEAYKYINDNPKVGAFNGAVVPKTNENLSDKQKDILKVTYKGLACTHMSIKEINKYEKNHPCGIPFGAGLVIKTKPLLKLVKNGWLLSKGRTKENLISGEDTEMCIFVKEQGYEFGYNPNMIIEHIISKNRLEERYSIELYKSFAEYNYIRMSNSNLYILRRIKNLFIASKNIIKLKYQLFNSNSDDFIKEKIKIESNKVIIKNIIRDKIILK